MELLFYFINNTKNIISDSYAAKQRKSSSKLLNRKKNGGQRNWFRNKSGIGPAASTNQIVHFHIGSDFFVLALF